MLDGTRRGRSEHGNDDVSGRGEPMGRSAGSGERRTPRIAMAIVQLLVASTFVVMLQS